MVCEKYVWQGKNCELGYTDEKLWTNKTRKRHLQIWFLINWIFRDFMNNLTWENL